MPNTLPEQTALTENEAEIKHNDHQFFDPKSPEQPEQLFGVDTQAILRLGRAATALGALPSKTNRGLYAMPNAVRLMPLIEEMQSGAELSPEDIRPYRKPIKKLSPEVSFVDKAAATAGALAIGIPLRRALNRRIEREFPSHAAEAITQAREALASVEGVTDFVAEFKNPRQQFETEIHDLAQTVSNAITEQRDLRVNNNNSSNPEPVLPKGIAGFLTKALRKVRSFFGFFKQAPVTNTEITAYDAGAGLEKTLNSLSKDSQISKQKLPLLSGLILNKMPQNIAVTKDHLALVAPEILNFLFSISPNDKDANRLLDSVNRNPHELRFITKYKKRYGRYSLEGVQRASKTLIPAIRDILPTEGSKVREVYNNAQDFLKYQQPVLSPKTDIETHQPNIQKNGLRSRLRKMFSSRRKQKIIQS